MLRSFDSVLGRPSAAQGDAFIYEGDCLELMKKLPDGIVSLTITSPPYNIGKAYEDKMDIDKYLDWCASWLQEIYRVTAPNGALWLNLGYLEIENKGKAIPISYLLWDRTPFYLLQEIVWNYGAGVTAKRSFCPRNEKVLWYVKDSRNYTFNLDEVRDKEVKYPNQKKNGKLKCNPLGKNPGDVWQIPKVTSGAGRSSKERTDHPAQFPIALVDRVVKACSNKGELIMDPFIGSGSTAESCLRNGRHAIGFEVKPQYINIANRRLQRYLELEKVRGEQRELYNRI